jgi:Flp pilus assembly protein TadG
MEILSHARKRARKFLRNESGAFSVLLAAGLFALVGAVAIATDAARGYMVKARLSQALDAAALAGGRNMFSATRDDEIRMYFQTNFPQDFMGATVNGPNIVVSEDFEKVTLTASASIDTTFMRVLGFEKLDVSAENEVTRQIQQLDVVLAMDMSGSMAWSAGGGLTRIQATRNAAKELVSLLFGNDADKDLLNIGLVPWNGKVNVMLNGTTFDPAQNSTEAVAAFTNPISGLPQTEVQLAGPIVERAARYLEGLRVFALHP